MRVAARFSAYLQVAPLTIVFVSFLLFPLLAIVVVSFWDYTAYTMVPTFILTDYRDVLSSTVTYTTCVNTFKYAAFTWFFTLTIGFTVAYFLAFHVRTLLWQLVLFLICTAPFLASNIIRMISWVPFLGRHGIFNSTLQATGLISAPLEFLLFSDFAVVLAFVHLYSLFMVIPIFNSMMRIDRALLAAAADCGASGGQILRDVILPLSKPGMAIGSISVVTLVIGDFVTVRLTSGGQSASVGLMMMNQMALLQYPAAAANAVILLIVTLLIVMAMVRPRVICPGNVHHWLFLRRHRDLFSRLPHPSEAESSSLSARDHRLRWSRAAPRARAAVTLNRLGGAELAGVRREATAFPGTP